MRQENIYCGSIGYDFLVPNKNISGDRIRQARRAARPPISQTDLAARLEVLGVHVDRSAVSKIENGKRPVTDLELAAIAKAIRISVSWLMHEVGAKST